MPTSFEAAMVTAWQAVANAVPPEPPQMWDPRLLWATLALVAIILVGALLIFGSGQGGPPRRPLHSHDFHSLSIDFRLVESNMPNSDYPCLAITEFTSSLGNDPVDS